jgi:hypothetical protein
MRRCYLVLSVTTADQVYVGRWAKTLATGETGTVETLLQAVNALMDYNLYGGCIWPFRKLIIRQTRTFSVWRLLSTASVSRIFGITTDEAIRWWPQPLPICRRN